MSTDPTHARRIKVWDGAIRVFHWALVSAVAVGFITGYVSPEWWMGSHIWAGYATVVLIVFRLVWGIFGSEYARIETFVFSPKEVLLHIREIISMRPTHYVGHNPSGAMMIFALLFVLAGITLSGLIALGGEENQGPLAGVASFAIGDVARGAHNILVYTLMIMIIAHIGGVLMEIKITGEDLVRSMITGYKDLPENMAPPPLRKCRPGAAVVTMGAFVIVVGSVLWVFSTMPPSGLRDLAANETYETNCADCHQSYHPSLLPAASWTKMMQELDDHFGEDATLDDADTIEITAYLSTHASEAWDTEAANRLRTVDAKAPYQITATPYWIRKHSEISKDVFKRKAIGQPGHCAACHQDDKIGRFDDQMIKIPPE